MTEQVEELHLNKKQKIEDSKGENFKIDNENSKQKQILNKCSYINPKKNKQCGLQVRKGQIYCFAHINSQVNGTSIKESEITKLNKNGDIIKRIKCPIDNSHSIWEDKLTKHLRICNITKSQQEIEDKDKNIPWFKLDYNIKDVKNDVESNNEIDQKYWNKLIIELVKKYDEFFKDDELSLENSEFKQGLEERFKELSNLKHIRQQSSLIGQLINNGLVKSNVDPGIIIEFGCGRAEFSRYFNKAIKEINNDLQASNKYLLIDRENPRVKFDNKIIHDSNDCGINNDVVKRLKVDIKDLKLSEALKEFNSGNTKYLGISKHLCGVATDLTLRCLINESSDLSDNKLNGCLIAMCCRHCCKYEWLLDDSKKYLYENFNINEGNFNYCRKMFAWATNGVTPGMSQTDIGGHFTGLSFKEREEIGLKMRRILDESRKFAMISKGFDVKIVKYVERDVSLENNCIIIKGNECL